MLTNLELYILGAAILLLISVLASKISDRYGVPALLLFLVIGMLAGSDGPGGIYFDNHSLAKSIGDVALILILFSGGLDTDWKSVRPVLRESGVLATLGVLITAVTLGLIVHLVFGLPILHSMLVGSIVSSTDAAAVFSILRSKGISLKEPLRPLLELESGSNDPMAIFLTTGMIQLLTIPGTTIWDIVPLFFTQMIVGGLVGYVMARISVGIMNRLKLGYEGLYPVLMLALVLLTYGLAVLGRGSGFLAAYLLGLVMSKEDFLHRRSMLRFYDGMAWLMQIIVFLVLGLLVFPSRLLGIAGSSLLISAALMLVARPVSVFLGMAFSRSSLREKLFVSWVGLRGAVPVILGTYPLMAGIPQADVIFHIVFFIVLTSVLLQGTSIPLVARWLKVDKPLDDRRPFPIEYFSTNGFPGKLQEIVVPDQSAVVGRPIVELHLPDEFLIILIARGNRFVLPSGGTILEAKDTLLVLSDQNSFEQAQAQITATDPRQNTSKENGSTT
ncbi:MAG: potassium/proton antiporter [Anaerolineae bacterium]